MAKKTKTEATTNKTKKIAYIIAAILVGIIVLGSIFGPSTKEAEAPDVLPFIHPTYDNGVLPGSSILII